MRGGAGRRVDLDVTVVGLGQAGRLWLEAVEVGLLADREDEIGFLDKILGGLPPDPYGEGVVLREAALRLEGGEDGGSSQLCEAEKG